MILIIIYYSPGCSSSLGTRPRPTTGAPISEIWLSQTLGMSTPCLTGGNSFVRWNIADQWTRVLIIYHKLYIIAVWWRARDCWVGSVGCEKDWYFGEYQNDIYVLTCCGEVPTFYVRGSARTSHLQVTYFVHYSYASRLQQVAVCQSFFHLLKATFFFSRVLPMGHWRYHIESTVS
jgi:hypothetical protein